MVRISVSRLSPGEQSTIGGRPTRIARRPLNHPVPEDTTGKVTVRHRLPTTLRPEDTAPPPPPSRAAGVDHVEDEEMPSRPERRSGSLDSKRPATRKHSAAFHGLSASALLAAMSTGSFRFTLQPLLRFSSVLPFSGCVETGTKATASTYSCS